MMCIEDLACYGVATVLMIFAALLIARWFIRGPQSGSKIKKRLDGKIVVITGSNTGIGKETAKDLAGRGARVIMLCRSIAKAQEAAAEIKEATGVSVEIEKLDLSSLQSVRECAEKLNKKLTQIDYLINNAGVMISPLNMKTKDGFDLQFGTNHLGHFLLTELLMPLVKKSASKGFHPRIVIVSSLAHTFNAINWEDLNFNKGGNSWQAYGQSKLANVLHAKELARRLEGSGITVYSLHPGAVNTDLGRHMLESWYWPLAYVIKSITMTPLNGAQTTLYCVLEDALENESGLYYSDCKEKTPHRRAMIEADQKRMWKISEEMVGQKSVL